jgi:hypothetical protein
MKEGFVKALLRHIFGVLRVFGYPLRYGENPLPVTENQFLERLHITALYGGNQHAVGVILDIDCASHFHEFDPPLPCRCEVTAILEKAIALPEAVRESNDVETSNTMGDTRIHERLESRRRLANLSESWHSVYRTG